MTCSIHRAFCLSGWLLILLSLGTLKAARAQPAPETVAALRNLSAEVLSKELREKFKDQTWRALRERGDAAEPTQLSKRLGLPLKEAFAKLLKEGLMEKADDGWQLTENGKENGGEYRETSQHGQYIAWPKVKLRVSLSVFNWETFSH